MKRSIKSLLPLICGVTLWFGTACGTAYAQQNDGVPSDRADAPTGTSDGPAVDPGSEDVPAVKPEEQGVRERVEFLLSGYEYFPSREDLDKVALAGEMTPVLQVISVDDAAPPSMRSRAVDALGFYDDEATIVHLRKLALKETDGLPRKKLRSARARRYHAITSFARAAGEQALGDLQGLMEHKDVQVQLSAISAIGKHCGAPGKEVLKTRQGIEQDQVILRELRKHTGQ